MWHGRQSYRRQETEGDPREMVKRTIAPNTIGRSQGSPFDKVRNGAKGSGYIHSLLVSRQTTAETQNDLPR